MRTDEMLKVQTMHDELMAQIEELKMDLQERDRKIEELKMDLQEADELTEVWKERCESVIRDTQASEKMSREEWWQAAWR